MDKLLTLTEAAALINVHPETLRRWDNDKTLVAVRVNDRGDRRYRESDILNFISTHKTTISHAKTVNIDGYEIRWWDEDGFSTLSGNFHLIGKLYATKDDEFIGFAFYVDYLEKLKSKISEDELDKLAMEKVIDYFKTKKVYDGDIVTYEYLNHTFFEVQNPNWWESKYSKSLVDGLRIEASHSCPIDSKNIGWRVILTFKSKNAGAWLSTPFGPKNDYLEYYVWIDSKGLVSNGYSNTAKGAEVLALEFGIKRFNETKDQSGNRSIVEIREKNSAFFNGEWKRDSLLPDS